MNMVVEEATDIFLYTQISRATHSERALLWQRIHIKLRAQKEKAVDGIGDMPKDVGPAQTEKNRQA